MVRDAIAILTNRKFSQLPVVDERNSPVGILDITDLIGLLPQMNAASPVATTTMEEQRGRSSNRERDAA